MSECLTLELLERLASGEAADPELREHVSSCSRCAAEADRLREHLALADELAQACAAAPTSELDAPLEIAGYELLGEIHRGGQGVVHRAVQRATRRTVAVKVLLERALGSARRRRRFEREVEVVASFAHPRIVTVHDSGQTADGKPYLVMELVEGAPLDEHARAAAARGDLAGLLRVFVEVCDAVSYAHRHGVIHRDLKPSNVLVDRDGAPHVLDFGLAKRLDESALDSELELTRSGEFAGTLAYAAPEQLSAEAGAIDTRTDVYALGVLLHQALTGRFPYPLTGKMADVAQRIVRSDPPPPSRALASGDRGHDEPLPTWRLDADLDTIVGKALAKAPVRRYQSAGELGDDLERFLRREPIVARGANSWYLLTKLVGRHRLASALSAAAVLLVLALSIVASILWRKAERTAAAKDVQARRAGVFSGFIHDALDANRPGESQGRIVTVREILDRASQRLRDEPVSDREVEAELRAWLGYTYLSLGLHGEAEPHVERALALHQQLFGPVHALVAHDLLMKHHVARDRGDLRSARKLVEQARAIQVELRLPEDSWTIGARGDLAVLAFDTGDPAEAERQLQAAEAAATGSPAALAELPYGLTSFGTLLNSLGHHRRAEEKLRRALELWRDEGAVSTQSGHCLRAMAWALDGQRRHAEALRTLVEARELFARLLGEESNAVTLCLVDEALLRARTEGPAAARPLFPPLLARVPELVRRPSLNSAHAVNALGVVALEIGEFDRAERFLRDALDLYVGFEGASPRSVATVQGNLAEALGRRGEWAEAEVLCREALGIEEPRGPSSNQAKLLRQLAWTLNRRGAREEAEACAARSVAMSRELVGDESEEVSDGLVVLGFVHCSQERWEEAEERLNEAVDLRSLLLGDDHLKTAEARHFLGWTHLCQKEDVEAAPLLEDSLAVRREALDAGSPDLIWSLNAVGILESRRDRLDAAESLLREAVERSRTLAADRAELLPISLLNLATFLEARRMEPAAAVPLLRERDEILRAIRGAEAGARR